MSIKLSSKESPTDQRIKCSKCEKDFKSRDKSVKCGTCQQTFHAKCQNVSDRNYDTLKEEGDDTMWLCLSCNQVTRGMVQNITSIQRRVSALEANMEDKADRVEVQQVNNRLINFMQGTKSKFESKADKNEMENLSQRVTTIEQKVNNDPLDKESEDLAKLLEEKIKEQKELISQRSNKTESSLSDAGKEMEDRDRRKTNIVLHNIIESSAADSNAKKSHDVQLVEQLFRQHLKVDVAPKLDNNQQPLIYRLGKKNDGKLKRSMKIVLQQPEDVSKVLKNAKSLALSTDKDIKKIVIKPDLMPMQREEELKLVKEKNEKNKEALTKNAPADWIIQRWRVVRRPRNQVPKANAATSTGSLNEEFADAANEIKDQGQTKKEKNNPNFGATTQTLI